MALLRLSLTLSSKGCFFFPLQTHKCKPGHFSADMHFHEKRKQRDTKGHREYLVLGLLLYSCLVPLDLFENMTMICLVLTKTKAFTKCLLFASYYSENFIWIVSFIPHCYPMMQILSHPLFTDEETDPSRSYDFLNVTKNSLSITKKHLTYLGYKLHIMKLIANMPYVHCPSENSEKYLENKRNDCA